MTRLASHKHALFRRPLFLQWIRRSIAVGIPSNIGNHVDVRVCATVAWVSCANFKYSGRPPRSIYQMMAVWITAPERRTVPGAQCFFAGVGDQCQLTIEHPDEFVLMTVPMTLAGPSTRLDDSHIHAELSQSGIACQPLTGLSDARFIKGTR